MKLTTTFSQLTEDELSKFNVTNTINFNRHQLNMSIDESFRRLDTFTLHKINSILESSLSEIDKLLYYENETTESTKESD